MKFLKEFKIAHLSLILDLLFNKICLVWFFSPKIKSSPIKGSEQFLTGGPGIGRT